MSGVQFILVKEEGVTSGSCVCVLVLGMLPKNTNETDAESDENIPVVEYTDESDYDSSETSEDESDPINR